MAGRSGKDSGFRVEIHKTFAPMPSPVQRYQIGSLACSTTADGQPDIQLCDMQGSPASLSYLLAQLFVPLSAKAVCRQPFWDAVDNDAAREQLSMFVQGRPVDLQQNLWEQATILGAKRSPLISVKLGDESVGSMLIMPMPKPLISQLHLPEHCRATGIIWVLPGSDAVGNIFPEVKACFSGVSNCDAATASGLSEHLYLVCSGLGSLSSCTVSLPTANHLRPVRRSLPLQTTDGRPMPQMSGGLM